MPKRKKHPVLPNGWGTIRYLGKGRSRPYAVHPPCTERYENGYYKRPPVLCYVKDWYTGFAVLNAYRAGTYKPGDELNYPTRTMSDREMDEFCEMVIRSGHIEPKGMTFEDVYKEWFEWKFGENAPKRLSISARRKTTTSYIHLDKIKKRPIRALRTKEIQDCINECQLGEESVVAIVQTVKAVCKYALVHDIIDKDYSVGVVTPNRKPSEHGVPFTDADLKKLWEHRDNETSKLIIIMCLSGYRISAYNGLSIKDGYFQGGVKTAKDRIVPIHSAIADLVPSSFDIDQRKFRDDMRKLLKELEIDDHTPHDCRHTFSSLCERFGVREADRKRMLGHRVGDITNDVYGHRTVEELRKEIEKIDFVSICVQ